MLTENFLCVTTSLALQNAVIRKYLFFCRLLKQKVNLRISRANYIHQSVSETNGNNQSSGSDTGWPFLPVFEPVIQQK